MKDFQKALLVCRNPERIEILSDALTKNGVEVLHFHNGHDDNLFHSKMRFDVVITCLENGDEEWTVLETLADAHPMLFLSANGSIRAIGPDFADAWLSLDDVDELLYKAALKAIERKNELKVAA